MQSRRGFVLPTVILAITVMSLIAVAALTTATDERRASRATRESTLAMYAADLLTIPPNMAGLPGLSIPCGLSEGLPVGLQIVGPQFSENLMFRAGHALERALGFDYVPERLRA